MELILNVYYDTKNLVGKPNEFDPMAVIWTTDSQQTQTLSSGRAVHMVPLSETGQGQQSTFFRCVNRNVPINDLTADLCIGLYVKTESDGSNPHAGKTRPFTIALGQCTIPWHVIVRFLISNGNALLAKTPDEGKNLKGIFPVGTVNQEIMSLVTAEGVVYRIQSLMESGETELALQLQRMGPESLSKRGSIRVKAAIMVTDKELENKGWKHRLAVLEQYFVNSAPENRDNQVALGHVHTSAFVEACQQYDRLTKREDDAFIKAMERYKKQYDALWVASSGQLVVRSFTGDKTLLLEPDVPSMKRFRLPLWFQGPEMFPYAEWILHTLPCNSPHMPAPGVKTEAFLLTLVEMAFKRVSIGKEGFVETVTRVTIGAKTTSHEYWKNLLIVGTEERTIAIKCVEIAFYTVMMVAHACRYSGDGRYVKVLLEALRLDVECPQHDTVSGTADDADCEDMAKVIIIIYMLMEYGRVGGDVITRGRGWSHPLLSSIRNILLMYADFSIFGSVCGRQLSDAERKRGNADEEGLIYSPDDISEPPGGHTFCVAQALGDLARRCKKHSQIIDAMIGESAAEAILAYVCGVIRGWLDLDSDTELVKRVEGFWSTMPPPIMEGTGRQEPLQLTLESYFGLNSEFLKRVAERASELDLLKRWPTPPKRPEKKQKAHRHEGRHHQSSSVKVKEEPSQAAIYSMGDAAPYAFQKRLTMASLTKLDVMSGNSWKRHLSPFYRRACHTVSCKLNLIRPQHFSHLIWINPELKTYGTPVRFIVEPQGAAIPIPFGHHLRMSYLSTDETPTHTSKVDVFMLDLVAKRMRRVIPYDLSFANSYDTINEADIIVDSKAVSANSSSNVRNNKDFFCRADYSATVSQEKLGWSSTNGIDSSALEIRVDSDSAIAEAMRNTSGNPETTSLLVPSVYARMVTRPPDGIIGPHSVSALSDHVRSGVGVRHVAIYSERTLPWLMDNLCAHYSRDVRFVISNDSGDNKLRSNETIHSNTMSVRMLQGRLQILLASQGLTAESILAKLRVDPTVIRSDRLIAGMQVELEHGRQLGYDQTNVTRDDLLMTAQIALAHFVENPGLRNAEGQTIVPDYYELLEQAERQSDQMWANHVKPVIFLDRAHHPSARETSQDSFYRLYDPNLFGL